jgi:hypothetical protein
MARIVVLLESMWGWGGFNTPGEETPRHFCINPRNFSGRRLYRLCSGEPFLVTNSCRYVQSCATAHGTPDTLWVYDNLRLLMPFELLLVCGKIAQSTFEQVKDRLPPFRYLYMDHPAARRWSNAKLDDMTYRIAEELGK